jgi:hypothetical protein
MTKIWAGVPQRLRRPLMISGSLVAGLAAVMAVAVGVTETSCRGVITGSAPTRQVIVAQANRRDEVNSYLTYPEWSIVYGYDDLAGVMRASSESDFGYWRSIRGFWSGLCGVKKEASSRGRISFDYNSMLYTIGVSYTLEMGIKGLYETTVGRLTAWIRGPTRTPEDTYALQVADDYAAFLRQVPWYEFPFGQRLARFWIDTPLWGGNIVRKIERRVAFTLEYGSKALYAQLIKALAGLNPAPLRLQSVVKGYAGGVSAIAKKIDVIKDVGNGAILIETQRYQEFTDIVGALAFVGVDFVEIAGNTNILVTIVAPSGSPDPALGRRLFSVPIQARPGKVRIGTDVRVDRLGDFVRALPGAKLELEHVYDY